MAREFGEQLIHWPGRGLFPRSHAVTRSHLCGDPQRPLDTAPFHILRERFCVGSRSPLHPRLAMPEKMGFRLRWKSGGYKGDPLHKALSSVYWGSNRRLPVFRYNGNLSGNTPCCSNSPRIEAIASST